MEIDHVHLDIERLCVTVTWKNGAISSFANVFLRDNCPADHTIYNNNEGAGRKMFLSELDVDIKPYKLELFPNGVSITWDSLDPVIYTNKWLQDHDTTNASVVARHKTLYLERTSLWNANSIGKLKLHDFEECLLNGNAMFDALKQLHEYGLLMFENVPCKTGQNQRLIDYLGFKYSTHYGTPFTVKSSPNPKSVGNTTRTLEFHLDAPYYEYVPPFQTLHCIEQIGEGGSSVLVDGFNAAVELKKDYPALFELLTTVPIDFEYIEAPQGMFHRFLHRWPTVKVNNKGFPCQITYSNHQRGWFIDEADPVRMRNIYKAIKTFGEYLYKEENVLRHKMRPGQMVVFENTRVLHGRDGFKISENTMRHLEGIYLTRDSVQSKIRMLAEILTGDI